jgi:hypothetical protein
MKSLFTPVMLLGLVIIFLIGSKKEETIENDKASAITG